jgi:hypothetical protein
MVIDRRKRAVCKEYNANDEMGHMPFLEQSEQWITL